MTEYISREAAINEVLMGNIDKDFPRMDIAARLHDIPAADVRPVERGKWVEKKHATMHPEDYFCRMALSCSICGHEIDYGRGYGPNYCGNCGADMRKEIEHEHTD